jgi:hypothetical protein
MKQQLGRINALAVVFALAIAAPASALPVLVSQQPWGTDRDVNNFNAVFGAGNYTFYNSFASATPAASSRARTRS